MPELPFKTTVLNGAVDLGEPGIRMLGVGWLVIAAALCVAAIVTVLRLPGWQTMAGVALGLSMLICILGWPDARLGVLANAVILLMIVLGTRAHWL